VLEHVERRDNVGGTGRRSDVVQRPLFDSTLTKNLASARARICVWFDASAASRAASVREALARLAPFTCSPFHRVAW